MPTFNPTIIQTILNLAANNRLVDPHDIDIETDVPWWTTGALFATTHLTSNKVLPLLALTKLEDSHLALTLDPTNPTLVKFNPNVEFTLLASYRATKIAIRDHAKAQGSLPLLHKDNGTRYNLHKLDAIHQSLLQLILQDNTLHHPAHLHHILEQTDNPNKTEHQEWLRVATLHGTDPQASIVRANLRPHTTDLPQTTKTTITNDLTDLLGTNDHPLIQHLEPILKTETAPINNTPAPTLTDLPNLNPPPPPQTPQTPINNLDSHPIPRLPRHRAHPNNLTGTYTRHQPPRNYSPPTPTPPRHPPHALTPVRSPQILAQQRLEELLQREDLTTEEFNHMRTLVSIVQTPTTEPTQTSHLLPNLLGWAGLSGDTESIQYFHDHTNNFWRHFLQATTTASRITQIDQFLLPNLTTKHPSLKKHTMHTWKRTLATMELAPQPIPPGTKAGLGPLAYINTSWGHIHAKNHHRELLQAASHTTTSDIAKAKAGDLVLPDRIDGLKAVLQRQHDVLYALFTPKCPLAIQLAQLLHTLDEDQGSIEESHDFRWTIAADILWQVSKATTSFFEHITTETDLTTGNLPRAPPTWLDENLSRGVIPTAINKPPLFTPPIHNPRRDQDKRPRPPSRYPGQPPRQTQKTQPTIHTQSLPQASADAIAAFQKSHPNTGLPRLAFARDVLKLDGDEAFASLLGVTMADCIRFHFYGKCGAYMCRRNHIPTKPTKNHATLVTKVLNAPNAARKLTK